MTATTPLVSIIITCYNYAEFLGEAIESALRQTYRPLEVIVVDDGSTDDSVAVASRYPVRLIAQKNRGLSAATNVGVRVAHCEYVMRLDADDVLYPSFVAQTLEALDSSPQAALAHADAEFFGTRSGRVPFQPFDSEALAQGSYATCCSLMRRTAWDAVGGLDESIPLCEDWDLWLAFADHGFTGVMVHRILWGYRQHGPSMVKRQIRRWTDVVREYRLIAHLQDNHPAMFTPTRLLSRTLRLPKETLRGQVSAANHCKIVVLYTVMLARYVLGLHRDGRVTDPVRPGIAGVRWPVDNPAPGRVATRLELR
jgi:glycosyltransferase involved in cell wall biosynthesis